MYVIDTDAIKDIYLTKLCTLSVVYKELMRYMVTPTCALFR